MLQFRGDWIGRAEVLILEGIVVSKRHWSMVSAFTVGLESGVTEAQRGPVAAAKVEIEAVRTGIRMGDEGRLAGAAALLAARLMRGFSAAMLAGSRRS